MAAAVAGLRPSEDILPCAMHGDGTLMVACEACRVWWAYREALRSAEYWREKYLGERRARRRDGR